MGKKAEKIMGGIGKALKSFRNAARGNGGDKSIMARSTIQQENIKNVYGLYIDEFSYLKPENIHYYMECSRKGLNLYKSLLFEECKRRDLRLGGICQTRKLAVLRKEWEVGYDSDSTVPEATQNLYKEKVYENLETINIWQLLIDIVDAQIQGLSIFEAVWGATASGAKLWSIDYVPNHLIIFDDKNNEYRFIRNDKLDMNILRNKGAQLYNERIDFSDIVYEPIDPMKILEVHSFDGNAQNGFLNGCSDGLIWGYIIKHFGLKDWSIWIELFASPPVIGKKPQLMGDEDKRAFDDFILNFSNMSRGVIPNDASVEFPGDTDKGNSTLAFKTFVEYLDKEMSIRVLGQELTTASGDKGSRALGQVQNMVREDLIIADMMLIKSAMNELIKRIIILNFGEQKEYPQWQWEEEVNIEYKKTRSEIIKNLHDSGHDCDKEDVEEEFDLHIKENATTIDNTKSTKFVDEFIERVIESV